MEKLGIPIEELAEWQLFKGKGCAKCNGSGYKGRVALYEVMPMDQELKEMIVFGASVAEIKEKAVEAGMDTLRDAALKKMKAGLVTMEEVVRVTKSN